MDDFIITVTDDEPMMREVDRERGVIDLFMSRIHSILIR